MSYFGLNQSNQNQLSETAASSPIGLKSDVGFFDNAVGAGVSGLYSGLVAKPDQLLWAGMDKVVSLCPGLLMKIHPYGILLKNTSPSRGGWQHSRLSV